jgi:hypothetical protein
MHYFFLSETILNTTLYSKYLMFCYVMLCCTFVCRYGLRSLAEVVSLCSGGARFESSPWYKLL